MDLVPTLAFLASFSEGISIIRNIENLKYKETNRLVGICDILTFFNVDFEVEKSDLLIKGSPRSIKSKSQSFCPLPDHRLVMIGSLFFKVLDGGEIGNGDCVSKSFPEFFSILNL